MSTILHSVGLLGAVVTAFAALGWGRASAVSVGAGALLATANLYGFARIVASLLAGSAGAEPETEQPLRSRSSAAWAVLALVKMAVLFGGVWLLMVRGWVAPLPLVVGYASLPLGIAIGSIVCDMGGQRPSGRGPGGS